MIMSALEHLMRLIHVLGAILWIGSIYFSASAIHQRAPSLFARDEDFEAFVTGLSDKNRYRHLLAFSASLLSGLALVVLGHARYSHPDHAYSWALIAVKGACFVIGALIFSYISWRLWPERIFALPQELEQQRRRGAAARWSLWTSLMLAAAAGVLLAHAT